MKRIFLFIFLCIFFFPNFLHSETELKSVFMENLTSPEIQKALKEGYTTVLIPTGGTEQNGPHMVLGKHNVIVRYACKCIAKELGHTLVTPVVCFVPEGDIDRKKQNMYYVGTLGVSEEAFALNLEGIAESLAVHGFKTICFVGDHKLNQEIQNQVAQKLNKKWAKKGVRIIHVGDYYYNNGQVEWLKKKGETDQSIGLHAAIRDTSEMMYVQPDGIRSNLIQKSDALSFLTTGVYGDPTHASAGEGKTLLNFKIQSAVKQIQENSK